MKKSLFCLIFVICLSASGFAQSADDDKTSYYYTISCDDDAVRTQIDAEIKAILQNNNYVNANKKDSDYTIQITVTFENQQLSGPFPKIKIPSISVLCFDSKNDEVIVFKNIYGEKIKTPSNYLLTNIAEFEELQEKIISATIKQLSVIEFPRKVPEDNKTKENPDIEQPDNDQPVEKQPEDVQTSFKQPVKEETHYELTISAGFGLSQIDSDDGLGKGTSDPSLFGVNIEFTLKNVVPIVIPKFTLDGAMINETDEEWISRSNKFSGSMLNIGIAFEVNVMQLLSQNSEYVDENAIQLFAGLGFRFNFINLKRTDVTIGEFSYPDEETSSNSLCLVLPVRVEFERIFESDFSIDLLAEASLLFGNELTGGFKFNATIEYMLSQSSALLFCITIGHCEYSLSEEESISQGYQKFYLGYSIKF